jgi:hypothetical protein
VGGIGTLSDSNVPRLLPVIDGGGADAVIVMVVSTKTTDE